MQVVGLNFAELWSLQGNHEKAGSSSKRERPEKEKMAVVAIIVYVMEKCVTEKCTSNSKLMCLLSLWFHNQKSCLCGYLRLCNLFLDSFLHLQTQQSPTAIE